MQAALVVDNALNGSRHLRGVSDVSLDERNVHAEFLGQLLPSLFIHVTDCHLCAFCRQHADCSRAQSGSAAGDQCALVLNVHGISKILCITSAAEAAAHCASPAGLKGLLHPVGGKITAKNFCVILVFTASVY